MDELEPTDTQPGAVERLVDDVVAKEIARKLGTQLGEGLASGATTIPPEKRKELEETIEALIAVAAARSGKGLREEVGPEFRRIVRRDIVEAFSDGVRGDLGDSLELTVDRLVDRAMRSLEENLEDPGLRYTIGDVMRDAVRDAVEGSGPTNPGIGDTLQETLTTNVLDPFSSRVGGVADVVARQVNQSAERTENLLKTIIGGLAFVLASLAVLYIVRDRQARRAREMEQQAQRGLMTVGEALDQLDEASRRRVQERLAAAETLFKGAVMTPEQATQAQKEPSRPFRFRRRKPPSDPGNAP
jgi:hypothetical protein